MSARDRVLVHYRTLGASTPKGYIQLLDGPRISFPEAAEHVDDGDEVGQWLVHAWVHREKALENLRKNRR